MRDFSLVQKLIKASPREIGYIAEAGAVLAAMSVAIWLLPFRKIVDRGAGPDPGRHAGPSEADASAIGLAVERASRRIPWRTVCFHEALTAQWMLRRRGAASTLHYGLSNGDELKAHTWVTLGERVIVGGRAMAGYHCVATFPRSSSR